MHLFANASLLHISRHTWKIYCETFFKSSLETLLYYNEKKKKNASVKTKKNNKIN